MPSRLVEVDAAALLHELRQAEEVIAGAACIQAAHGGGQFIDLAAKGEVLVHLAARAAVIAAKAVVPGVQTLAQQVFQLGAAGVLGVDLGQGVGVQRVLLQGRGKLGHRAAAHQAAVIVGTQPAAI